MAARPLPAESFVMSDLVCSVCGYGIATQTRPVRCPMCQESDAWVKPQRPQLGRAIAGSTAA